MNFVRERVRLVGHWGILTTNEHESTRIGGENRHVRKSRELTRKRRTIRVHSHGSRAWVNFPRMKTVWRVFAYLKRYPWMAAGTLSCAILTTLMVIVFPGATKLIINGVVAVLQIVIVLAVMFYWNAKLAILALVPFPLLIGGALAYTLTAHRRYRLQRRASSVINALLHDNLAGIRQIKSFVREREEHARFNRASDQLRRATLVVMRVWAIYSPSMSMFEAIGALLILGFGGHAALTGEMQIGDLVAFLMLTAFLYDPVSRLHQLNQLVQAGRAAGERVFEILDELAEPGDTDSAGTDRPSYPRHLGRNRYQGL